MHRLLGGAARTEIEAYASLLVYGVPHVVADKAAGAVAEGFRHVKLHEVAPAPVLAARDAVGADVELMLDPNCAWSTEHALRLVDTLAPADLRWVEDAIWPPEDHESMRQLRHAGMRVAAGRTPAPCSTSRGCSNGTRSMSRNPT